MSILVEYIKAQAAAKDKTPTDWLKKIVEDAAKCRGVTHIGKFTDPAVDSTVSLFDKSEKTTVLEDYVCTATVLSSTDMVVSSAAFLPTAKLLMLPLEDGRTFLEHIMAGSEYVDELKPFTDDLEETKKKLECVISGELPQETAENIRQVYFPVGEGYHLLSTLTSSSVLYELKARIQEIERSARAARSKGDDHYGESHALMTDLTAVGFGGTKPQNVSLTNNNQGGIALLLPSCLPTISHRDVVIPRDDFFANTLWHGRFRADFDRLHAIFKLNYNNAEIRELRVERTADIIDKVMMTVYALRELEPGWSEKENNRLPQSQKLWLDEKNAERRNQEDAWIDEIAAEFSRWLLRTYERFHREDRVDLGEEELRAIRLEIKETLLSDRR